VARLALILALVALVFSWAAYRRAGGKLTEIWSDVTRGAADFRVGSPTGGSLKDTGAADKLKQGGAKALSTLDSAVEKIRHAAGEEKKGGH
jgi:hypothetical protein